MANPKDKVRNIILCEDIRDEVGNKKSLMGVMAGDILVGEFPATLSVAVYFEYVPDDEDRDLFSTEFRLLQNDDEIVRGEIKTPIEAGKIVTVVLPRGLMLIQADAFLRMVISVNGSAEFDIINKRVSKN